MTIDKRDFDANRPLLRDVDAEQDTTGRNAEPSWRYSRRGSRSSGVDGLSDDGLLSDVVEEIVERDRRRIQKEVIRVLSFGWGVVTWYGKLFFLAVMLTRGSISIGTLEADSYLCFAAWEPAVSLLSLCMAIFSLPDFITRSSRSMPFLSLPKSQCTFPSPCSATCVIGTARRHWPCSRGWCLASGISSLHTRIRAVHLLMRVAPVGRSG